MQPKQFEELLVVELSPSEVEAYSKELAQKTIEEARLKDEKAAMAERYNSKLKLIAQEIGDLADKVDTEKEMRMVKCEERPFFDMGIVKTVRLDTFDEVRRRDLRADERNGHLFENETGLPEAPASSGPTPEESQQNVQAFFGNQETAGLTETLREINNGERPLMSAPKTVEIEGRTIETELDQITINAMGSLCMADRITESKPCKIYWLQVALPVPEGEGFVQGFENYPLVVTSAVGAGANWMHVGAYSIDRAEGEEGAHAFDRAKMDQRGDTFFDGLRINCGSAKKPDWWIAKGPRIEFSVKREIDPPIGYPYVGVPEHAMVAKNDFTAPRCDECGLIDGDHKPECTKKKDLKLDDYIGYAKAMGMDRPASAARKLQLSGKKDGQIRLWLAEKNGEPAQLPLVGDEDVVEEAPKKKRSSSAKRETPEDAIGQ